MNASRVRLIILAWFAAPFRRRVQAPIDRRFNRARVDGGQVVEACAGRLRGQVGLDLLGSAALAAVDHPVAPKAASTWLRSPR